MRLPEGRLLRSRVVSDPRTALVDALDRAVTGYAVLEPQGSLLLDDEGRGVLTFEGGVPVVAYHTGSERGGPPALADLAAGGPYRLNLYAVRSDGLDAVHDQERFRVPPGMAAERLAGDQSLADRTREAAPADRAAAKGREPDDATDEPDDATDEPDVGAVEAFLDDERKIEAIREQAREEAQARAEEWGFGDVG
ncbi:MAG: hypothetical protein V5A44_05490 [Haloarculaceae archaeon]